MALNIDKPYSWVMLTKQLKKGNGMILKSSFLIHLSIKAASNEMHCLQMPRILKVSMYLKIT